MVYTYHVIRQIIIRRFIFELKMSQLLVEMINWYTNGISSLMENGCR